MRAMQVQQGERGLTLRSTELPQPRPGTGEILIRVHATGVTPTELGWYPTTHTKGGDERAGAIPGHEFSGVVAATGEDADGFTVGDEVYGMNDWFADGATAEYCLSRPESIARKPATLTHLEAATVPIGALTAWQGLLDRAGIKPKNRVLVHGGAGAVGIFAIQLAHIHGAHVIATVSGKNAALVAQLGADQVIDYKSVRFEDVVRDVDVVFDTVGGDTLERSWSLLKPGGRMITIAADGESSDDPRVKDAFFIVEPNQEQLIEVARLLDAGALKTFVDAAVPLEETAAAYARTVTERHGYGKVVVTISGS